MRIALVPGPGPAGLIRRLTDTGMAGEPAEAVPDLAAAIAGIEADGAVRWVWPSGAKLYPALLRAGVRVARCHDVELTGALLLARDGPGGVAAAGSARGGAVPAAAAAAARLAGLQAAPGLTDGRAGSQAAQLSFEAAGHAEPDRMALLDDLITVHADQLARIGADQHPDKLGLLVAAESAGALVAAEMTASGLPWRADVHRRLLTQQLGPRPPATAGPPLRPARLSELAANISAALGATRPVNPDSPAQLLRDHRMIHLAQHR